MSDDPVLIENHDRIATMTLNRPPMNPMSNRYEQEICREVFAHPDAAEGPRAFTEKREPRSTDL